MGMILTLLWVLVGIVIFAAIAIFAVLWVISDPPPEYTKEDEKGLGKGVGIQYPFHVPRGIGRGRG
jgi:nucleoside recognition membrane protein YjiH